MYQKIIENISKSITSKIYYLLPVWLVVSHGPHFILYFIYKLFVTHWLFVIFFKYKFTIIIWHFFIVLTSLNQELKLEEELWNLHPETNVLTPFPLMGATVGGGSVPSYKNLVVGTSHTPSLLNYEPSKMGSDQNLMQNNASFYSPSPMEEGNRTNTTTKKYRRIIWSRTQIALPVSPKQRTSHIMRSNSEEWLIISNICRNMPWSVNLWDYFIQKRPSSHGSIPYGNPNEMWIWNSDRKDS